MRRLLLMVPIVVVLAAALAGCGGGETDGGGAGEMRSERERVIPAAARPADLARDNSVFAFDLYQRLAAGPGNLFFSPHSLSLALAMTYAGAAGETARQMAETLHFRLPGHELHAAFNALDRYLAGRGAEGGFDLRIVNAVWGQRGHDFLPSFLDALAEHYGAGVRAADFRGAAEEARVAINGWVEEQTEDRIRDLVPPGAIDGLTRLVLTNAVYFKAAWVYPFEEGLTRPGVFRLLDGGEVETPMMHALEELGYARGNGWQAVDLPYEGGELSMVILLPDAGRFREFEAGLDAERVSGMLAGLWGAQVALAMPKFEFDSQFALPGTLKALGMADAFDPRRADFSGMDGRSCRAGDDACLRIADVVHKAFVSVDEAGTEVAAATAVMMATESAPPERVDVTIDRPFLFLIRDRATEAILFLGRLVQPETGAP